MSVKYICDGCGKEEDCDHQEHGVFKPHHWFARLAWEGDDNKSYARWLFACSRPCIEKINQNREEETPILPL